MSYTLLQGCPLPLGTTGTVAFGQIEIAALAIGIVVFEFQHEGLTNLTESIYYNRLCNDE